MQKSRVRYTQDTLIKVSTKMPFESFHISDPNSKTLSKAYPRVIRNRVRVEHLEIKLQVDMLRELDGLTGPQRDALLRIIAKNAKIRKAAGLEPGVFEKLQDAMYDEAMERGGPLIKSISFLHQTGYESDPGPVSDGPVFVISSVDDGPPLNRDQNEEIDDIAEEITTSFDDITDLEFPIEDYELKAKKKSEDEDEEDAYEDRFRNTRMSQVPKGANLSHKYGEFVETDPSLGQVQQVRSRAVDSNKTDLEFQAMQQMRKVSTDLQKWATDVLDNSIQIDPEILAAVNKVPETTGSASNINVLTGVESRPKSNQGAKPNAKELVALERVDITGFDVLLNACKPSILEAKPPVRLNVVHEINPPDTLVNNLQKNLGMNIDDKNPTRNRKVLPEVDSSFTYRKKIYRPRPHYGAWYVHPKQWNEYMTQGDPKKKKAEEKTRRVGGIVQEKLDQINRKREQDQEKFMKELEASSMAPESHSADIRKAKPKLIKSKA